MVFIIDVLAGMDCSTESIFKSAAPSVVYGGRESSTRCNFRKRMQIEKTPAN